MTPPPSPATPGAGDHAQAPLPLVGRDEELRSLESLLRGDPPPVSMVLVSGEPGAGKTRLVGELASRMESHGWSVARGRAYPVETGVPFALFSDAFLPILRGMEPDTLTVLSRGGEAELRHLFPALAPRGDAGGVTTGGSDPEEFRTRLFWNFAEFLGSFAGRNPLLVILEDLHWADESSLELLHFVARQAADHPLVFVCTYSESDRDRAPQLVQMERSLLSIHRAQVRPLAPLTQGQLTELVCRAFDTDAAVVREFVSLLFGQTRGNAFFAGALLTSLVRSGKLRRDDGRWLGWDARDLGLPGTIRDAVLARIGGFSEEAQRVAEVAAVVGARARYSLLAAVSGLDEGAVLNALEELCLHDVLDEEPDAEDVSYSFPHPLVREVLYKEFSLPRARMLHGKVAQAMEAMWGDEAMDHADELAYHLARTDAGHLAAKAVRYLAAAGQQALDRHADREAVNYLRSAMTRAERGEAAIDEETRTEVASALARAHLRLGAYDDAAGLWSEVLQRLPPGSPDEADVRRALGLSHFWRGRPTEALQHLAAGIAAAEAAGSDASLVQIRVALAHCLQELGRGGKAKSELEAALPLAEKIGDVGLLARVHRSLALLHVWIGPPEKARAHGEKAIELARACGDLAAEFWAIWGLAVLLGMRGDTEAMAKGIAAARARAEELRSPVLSLWTEEMQVELFHGTGDWEQGVALGERSIALARRLHQRTLLPRLLVWTSLFHVGRGDLERAEELVEEAIEISGLRHTDEGHFDVHQVVPAYIGLAHYQIGLGDYEDGIRAAETGLRIAEGTGYTLWVVHRLLPILAEGCLWAGEIDRAEEVGIRLRAHSEAMGHKLGIAWADACDGLVKWKRGDPAGGALLMAKAADDLEAIPMVPYAARIRRQLAGRLAEMGDEEGAVRELKRAHEVFAKLGAELELEKARMMFREIGQRPPPKGAGEGVGGLTARELEIARLVAQRKSNKAIGKALDISPRTASTHLSNIFQKLGISSRGELADLVREQGLLDS